MNQKIYLSPPNLKGNEQELLAAVFKSNWIAPVGPMLREFEKSISTFIGIENAVALNSATAAIHLALSVLGVGKGDKVLCSSFTFVASVNPVSYVGAQPILIDAEKETWNICPVLLEKAIIKETQKGKKPKALILVHGYGVPAQIDQIISIAKKYQLLVLEDAASALGSTYNGQFCGTFGDMGVFSFNGNKIITTSGGGMLVSKDKDKIAKALNLSRQAKSLDDDYLYQAIGYNYRMSNVLAALGVAQMELLLDFVKCRQQNHLFYKKALFGMEVTFIAHQYKTNAWLTVVLFKSKKVRDSVKNALAQENIESRLLWKPMHQQEIYKKAIFYANGISDDLHERGLCLPSGSALREEELQRVCSVIKLVING